MEQLLLRQRPREKHGEILKHYVAHHELVAEQQLQVVQLHLQQPPAQEGSLPPPLAEVLEPEGPRRVGALVELQGPRELAGFGEVHA